VYILLTDVVVCPRCGPEFGLIVLADRIDARRVVEGRLGCPNCRESYPVRDGVADLRPPGAPHPAPSPSADALTGDALEEEGVRLAALLGLADAGGLVLLEGYPATAAGAVSAVVPAAEVVAMTAAPDAAGAGPERVSQVLGTHPFPFRAAALRGVALRGAPGAARLAEGLRVLAPGSRMVVDGAAPGTATALADHGAAVLLDQEGVVVARAPGLPVEPVRNVLR
jgi:uncharacterized protein YbaR (Trm112 family)